MNDPKVRIRMYRTGLGDCHLVSFTLAGGKKRHILIDCGYFPGSLFPDVTMDAIVTDIGKKSGRKLNAVVVTHEHQDHLQGFVDREAQFQAMRPSELWMAWTEEPGQMTVPERRSLAALSAAAARLALTGTEEEVRLAAQIEGLLGFSRGTDRSFETVKSWFPEGARKYWHPGDVIEPAWLPGVRIYVLGPPKELALLHKKVGKKNVEMYELSGNPFGFAAAALQDAAPGTHSPFDRKYTREALPPSLDQSYSEESVAWRRIDHEWLLSAARIALQLDTYTNNTSLVLAFELIQSGRVLLFVGDAQIGSWLSWESLRFQVNHQTVTAADLLARTVFYKVGHHGSHNATLVNGGLLAMTSGNLQAAIPTHETWAERSRGWHMPNAQLFTELTQRCVKPVRRSDEAPVKSVAVQWYF